MVLYTDGVTEARGVNGFYGMQRMTKLVGAPARGPPTRYSPTS